MLTSWRLSSYDIPMISVTSCRTGATSRSLSPCCCGWRPLNILAPCAPCTSLPMPPAAKRTSEASSGGTHGTGERVCPSGPTWEINRAVTAPPKKNTAYHLGMIAAIFGDFSGLRNLCYHCRIKLGRVSEGDPTWQLILLRRIGPWITRGLQEGDRW